MKKSIRGAVVLGGMLLAGAVGAYAMGECEVGVPSGEGIGKPAEAEAVCTEACADNEVGEDLARWIGSGETVTSEGFKDGCGAAVFTSREFVPDEWTEVTATWYCPCEVCCGKWARNRPVREDGSEIVYGAWGDELCDGASIASGIYPAGTVLEIYGVGTRVVQDCGVSHGGIDFYCTDHDMAIENGIRAVYVREITK